MNRFFRLSTFAFFATLVSVFASALFLSCENQFFKAAAGIYEVSFETNGGTGVETMNTDKIKTAPKTTRQNCDFLGWWESRTFEGTEVEFPYEPNGDTILYAKWNQKYTVHFETNGGTAIPDVVCSELTALLSPQKDGCTFAGWYAYADFSGEAVSVPFVPAGDVVLYAKWLKNYTVTFNSNGGTEISSVKTGILQEFPIPEKQNYEFAGWFTSASLNGTALEVPFAVTADTVLYAKWLPTYLVTLQTNGGSEVAAFRTRTIEDVQTPEKSGFTFVAWCTDSTLTKRVEFPLALTADTTLYALFKQNFTVTFEVDGGNPLEPISTCLLAESPITTKTDKSLAGWYLDAECSDDKKVSFPYEVNADVTLYAKWVSEMYTITYDANGATSGTAPQSVMVEKGHSFLISANTGKLEKSGYAFTKWATSANGTSGQSYAPGYNLIPSKNMTLYAQWGKDYAAMVMVEGGSFYFGNPNDGTNRPKITLSSFQIAQYELTHELWLEVYTWAINNGYNLTSASKGYAPNDAYKNFVPATNISWNMACVWLNAYSEYKGLEPVYYRGNAVWKDDTSTSGAFSWNKTKNGYRLPTECEWEFTAGGGSATTHDAYIYSGSNTVYDVAWYSGNSGSEAHPVGTKKANSLGIYDMSRNVAEYCFDYYASYGTGELTNPVHESGSYRTIKGGSLKNDVTIVKNLTRSEVYDKTSGWYNTTSNSSSALNSYTYIAGIRVARNAE